MKKFLYFDIHVRYSKKDGHSLFFATELEKEWNEDDVVSAAVNLGELDCEDMEYVDSVDSITKREYEEGKGI